MLLLRSLINFCVNYTTCVCFHNTNPVIEFTQDLSVLVDHDAAQLEENGWQQLDASAIEDIAWSAWTATDEQNDTWNATFYILPRAGEENTYLATLRLRRQR